MPKPHKLTSQLMKSKTKSNPFIRLSAPAPMKASPCLGRSAIYLPQVLPLASAFFALLGAPSLRAATFTWATPGTSGNWSDAANWTPAGGLPNDGTAVANLPGGSTETTTLIDAATWTLSGLTASVSGDPDLIVNGDVGDGSGSTLSIGAGGIDFVNSNGNGWGGHLKMNDIWWRRPSSNMILNVTADQTWKVHGTGYRGAMEINADLTGSSVITIATVNTDWQPGTIDFSGGYSTGFTGSFVLNSGALVLNNGWGDTAHSQLARLGTNTMTWGNDTTYEFYGDTCKTILFPKLSGLDNTPETFATPINFQKTGGAQRAIKVETPALNGSSLALTGAWSGDLDNTGLATNASALNLINNNLGNYRDGNSESQVLVHLQADNSSLEATGKTGMAWNTSAFWFETGAFSVENANSLGAANALSVAVGDRYQAGYTALLTQGGIDIGSHIYVNGCDTRSCEVKLGVLGSGATTFSGDMILDQAGYGTHQPANVRFSAQAGATATFTGKFSTQTSWQPSGFATITAQGGGKIILTGAHDAGYDGLQGEFSVVGNTTLMANGGSATSSATGTGNVKVGAAATAITGTTTGAAYASNWAITGITSTAGLVVGQGISGDGIPAGSTVAYITANSIDISTRATATGTASLSAAAETGILAGTGRIAPGVVNSLQQAVTVAAGSSVAPGNDGTGTLTLDGTNTSASLLTMDAGSSIQFALGSGDSSTQLAFWNYVPGDLTLTGGAIALNFTGAQAGTYKLVSFSSDGGTTPATDGISGGLVLGSGLDGFQGTLQYNAGDVTLVLVAATQSGYAGWASGYSLDPLTTGAADADADHDGSANGIEFVTGANPTVGDTQYQPTSSVVGDNLVFVYRRTDASVAYNPVVQTSTTMADGSWSNVSSGIAVETGYYGTGVDRVTVTIPRGSATRLFARLNVVIP